MAASCVNSSAIQQYSFWLVCQISWENTNGGLNVYLLFFEDPGWFGILSV